MNRQSIKVAQKPGRKPTTGIPAADKGWDETHAKHRFFDHALKDRQRLSWIEGYECIVKVDLAISTRVNEGEWKGFDIINKDSVPRPLPELRELICQIAKRSGLLGRKSDGGSG